MSCTSINCRESAPALEGILMCIETMEGILDMSLSSRGDRPGTTLNLIWWKEYPQSLTNSSFMSLNAKDCPWWTQSNQE
ncbi:hypothetical protein EB796_014171 [Bugula neritina]|uniref:Uncharacterized protein n=1 Tax=Bugula neritina TaxID=10212 RepID=A0A7J7JN39_BUGNE|nr:hypothetical protein EB796_014171 [Bugula neritina]